MSKPTVPALFDTTPPNGSCRARSRLNEYAGSGHTSWPNAHLEDDRLALAYRAGQHHLSRHLAGDACRILNGVAADNVHPVRRVTVGDLSADIDEDLAPIIEAVWRLGIRTWTCCQNQGESNAGWADELPHMALVVAAQLGWAYIDFPVDDGLVFLTSLAQAGPRDAFYLRMTHWAAPDSWDVSARPMDAALFKQQQQSRFALRLLLVRFPSYDRDEILRRLANYEAGRLVEPGPIDRSSMGR